jgi:cytochrome c
MNKKSMALLTVLVLAGAGMARAEVDADAAKALMKKSNCGKCHALDKKKDGPPYKKTAEKYRGKPDAEQKLYIHLTTNPKVKVEGKEEEHTTLKTKKEADVRNVVRWILSQ